MGGKSKKKTFTAVNARNAQQQWEKWCQTLRDEQAFMDMVERKPTEEQKVVCGYPGDPIEEIRPTEEPVDIAPAPVPEISVRPWKEVAEERQKRIEELEAKVRELEYGTDVAEKKPVYVVWAKTNKPKLFGAYGSMDKALDTLDELNNIAAFLGNESAFEVDEVAWK